MLPTEVMIFAAGRGSRMLSFTDDSPKPLLSILGKPIIYYTLQAIQQYGFIKRAVINVCYKKEMLIDYLKKAASLFDFEIVISQEEESLGVGGGLNRALQYFSSPDIFTCNADSFISGEGLALLANAWRPELMNALLLCCKPEQVIGQSCNDFSIVKNPDTNDAKTWGKLGVISSNDPDLTYTGVQILSLDQIAKYRAKSTNYSIFEIYNIGPHNNKVYGVCPGKHTNFRFLHCNTPVHLKQVENYISQIT